MARHPLSVPKRPEGQVTRGKTARNRLRRIDALVLAWDAGLLRRGGAFEDALWVDLGYGAEPFTTLESAGRFRRAAPGLRALGVEIEADRVAAAQPFASADVQFRIGGFNLPLRDGESVRLVRALNVLRQYDEAAVGPALERLARYVLPGGLLVEGTSDPFGRVWVVQLLRRVPLRSSPAVGSSGETAWRREAMVFGTNHRLGFDPGAFQAVLPKDSIHRVVPGEAIHGFFEGWKRAAAETRAMAAWGQRSWWRAAGRRLADLGYAVDPRRRFLGRGWLVWRTPRLGVSPPGFGGGGEQA
ncbi:MAG: class I SAM-dependent methyltransferase [Acidobacteriota bacterium]